MALSDYVMVNIPAQPNPLERRSVELTMSLGRPERVVQVYMTPEQARSPEILGMALEDSERIPGTNLHLVKVCLTCRPAFRCPAHVHLATAKASPPAPVAAAPLPRECACGIARVDCDYHRA